jgi:hypothetical protein
LNSSTAYYWRVNAVNILSTSAWTTAWSFSTLLAAPVLTSPADQATGIAVAPTVTWNLVTGATSYTLQISTVSDFSTAIVNQAGINSISYGVNGLANNTVYYWRVNAVNTQGIGEWSTARSFTTIITSPAAPTLVDPANTATDVPINQILTWNAVSGSGSYNVQVSTSSAFTSTIVNATTLGTSYNLSSLGYNTVYYWRVQASNIGGTSAWTSVWNFRTAATVPAAVTLVAPADTFKSAADSVVLTWNKGDALVTKYLIDFADDSGFLNISIRDTAVTDTTKKIKGLTDKKSYWWRVKACNAIGWGPFSLVRKFTVIKPNIAVLPSAFNIKSFSTNKTARTINYALPKSCFVSVKYYDLRGRVICSFVNKIQPPGYYSLSYRTAALSRKVYIQEFQAGDFIKKEQMMVIK